MSLTGVGGAHESKVPQDKQNAVLRLFIPLVSTPKAYYSANYRLLLERATLRKGSASALRKKLSFLTSIRGTDTVTSPDTER